MRVVGRAEAALGLALLVVLVDAPRPRARRRGVAASSASATRSPVGRRVDGEADGQRPRQPAREPHLARRRARSRRWPMKPSSGESAPEASMSRSESSREVSVTSVRATRDPSGALAGPVDQLAAVRLDQAFGPRRRVTPSPSAGTSPSSSSFAIDELRALLRRRAASVSTHDLGLGWRLVRIVDAREALDLARERLRRRDPSRRAGRTRRPTPRRRPRRTCPYSSTSSRAFARVSLVRRDRRGDHRAALARQPRGDPADALDVRVAVLLREAEALREVRADRCRRRGTRRRGRGGRAPARRGARSSSCPTRRAR